LQNVLHA